jgi:hypothetical protein
MIGAKPLGGQRLGGRSLGAAGIGMAGRRGGGGPPVRGAYIELSDRSIDEDALVNDVVGVLSVVGGTGVYTFTITADPDNKFAIANDDELQIDQTLDYETATTHAVSISADNGAGSVVLGSFTVLVVNVAEGGVDYTVTYLSMGQY